MPTSLLRRGELTASEPSSAMNLLIHEQETTYPHDGDIPESDDQPTDKTPNGQSEAQNRFRPPIRQRLDAHRAFCEVLALTKFDFTRDVILIIELAGFTGPDKFEYVPLRNKIDTGSSENFISSDILTQHKMDEDKIIDLPISEQTERTLQMIEGTFTPKREVYLRWHRPHDARERRTRFLVVDTDQFDLVIGVKDFKPELPSAMWAWRGRQSKGLKTFFPPIYAYELLRR